MNGRALLMAEAVRLHQGGRLAEAAPIYRRLLAQDAGQPQVFSNLGAALRGLGQADEAAGAYRRAILLKPDFVDAYANYANLLKQEAEPGPAAAVYRRAAALKPPDPGIRYNLGLNWQEHGRPAEAAEAYEAAVRLQPAFPAAWSNLAAACTDLHHIEQAAEAARRAILLKPDLPQPYSALGQALQERGEPEAAIEAFDKALILQPYQAETRGNRLLAELYRPGGDLAARQALARRLGPTASPSGVAVRGERPRLGFVSADFRQHAVGFMLIPAIEGLRRLGYDIVCYDNSPRGDALTQRYRAASSQWRAVAALDDHRLEAQIRADGIGILFDLAGHSRGNRLSVFARRPAPLQISWAGYPATIGTGVIDHLLADRWQAAEGTDRFHDETLLRLPHSYISFEPQAELPDPGPPPALRSGIVTFASFNALKKINGVVIALWSRILLALPEARLLLKSPALGCPATRNRVALRFAAAGAPPDRIRFLGGSSPSEHNAAMMQADIGLDPFPYSGGLTTAETLWMGLPVITWPGESLASRHSFGYLQTIGLGTLAVDSADAYVELAMTLARDLPRLAALRQGMRMRMLASPLLDHEGFAADLSSLLETLWQRRRRKNGHVSQD